MKLNPVKPTPQGSVQNHYFILKLFIGPLHLHIKFLFAGLLFSLHINPLTEYVYWKNHIKQMFLKLSGPCYVIWLMVHISKINTIKSVYYAYALSVMKYEIICWGNSSNGGKIFTLQKKIFGIMAAA
jgi:hypothetical protein